MKANKFRIYDLGRREWVHGAPMDQYRQRIGTDAIDLLGETIVFGEILRRASDDTSVTLQEMNDLITVQYVGQQDIHGLDIYEGDILRDTVDGYEGYVEFYPPHAGYILRVGNGTTGLTSQYEILGNQFDDVELFQRVSGAKQK